MRDVESAFTPQNEAPARWQYRLRNRIAVLHKYVLFFDPAWIAFAIRMHFGGQRSNESRAAIGCVVVDDNIAHVRYHSMFVADALMLVEWGVLCGNFCRNINIDPG